MSAIELSEQLVSLLKEPLFGQQDIESQIRLLLEAEYLRRLSRYRRVDHTLSLKYGMSFDEFVQRRVVRERGYSWEVESDAMDWETAVGGIITMEHKLRLLRAGAGDGEDHG